MEQRPLKPLMASPDGPLSPVARQMLRIAEERGVAVDDLADLAKVVAALDVDSPIPLDALAAVSEILVYLFQADASLTQSGDAP